MAGLRYVYEGNIPGEGGENTYCYQCGEILIERYGYRIIKNSVKNNCCPVCSSRIDGIDIA
jgi:pyruvate formate lyase activating enzyme